MRTSVVTSLLLLGTSAIAAPLTPRQALARAERTGAYHTLSLSAAAPRLRYTAQAQQEPALYLFADRSGFMLVSADDSSPALLGYGEGELASDPADYPPAFRYWIAELSRQVACNARADAVADSDSPELGPAIAPMTTTRWNQGAPYYDATPMLDGHHLFTGCVATSTAQVIKYHNYPLKGAGTHSYTWRDTTLTFDYGAVEWEWDKFLNEYGTDDSTDDKRRIAQLMYAVGVSVDMGYDIGDSGASPSLIPGSLIEHFGYDKGARQYYRDYYSIDAWNELIYRQLSDYGPVVYTGWNDEGGHSFVCDGYSSDGYFHINWGWGGMSDGYYLLTALSPGQQGIGGTTAGYNYAQDIVGNITSRQITATMPEILTWQGAFTLEKATAALGDKLKIYGSVANNSAGAIGAVVIGVKLEPADAAEHPIFLHCAEVDSMTFGEQVRGMEMKLPDSLADGEYKVTPVFRNTSGTWEPIPVRVDMNSYYTLKVDGKDCTFTHQGVASIKVTSFATTTPVYSNANFEVEVGLENESPLEYIGSMNVFLADSARTVVATGQAFAIDVLAGHKDTVRYVTKLTAVSGDSIADGSYSLYLGRGTARSMDEVAGPIALTIGKASSPSFEMVSFDVPAKQSADDVTATATVKCKEGYFFGRIKLGICSRIDDRYEILHWINTKPEYSSLSAGESVDVEFDGPLDGASEGEKYYAVVFADNDQLSNLREFTIDVSTGVEAPEAGDEPVYYTISGVRLASMPSAPGIYIERRGQNHSRTILLLQ